MNEETRRAVDAYINLEREFAAMKREPLETQAEYMARKTAVRAKRVEIYHQMIEALKDEVKS